jgi:hypothetical protein
MAQGHQRQPFEMSFTFSLNNILSLVADHLSKKALLAIYQLDRILAGASQVKGVR